MEHNKDVCAEKEGLDRGVAQPIVVPMKNNIRNEVGTEDVHENDITWGTA